MKRKLRITIKKQLKHTIKYKGKIMTSAVIVAAGRGTRMKYKPNISKQHIDILGKSVVLRAIEKFIESESVDEIIIVIIKEEEEYFKKNVLSEINTKKPVKLIYGGSERFESSYNGIMATSEKSDIILVHDGVRPFVRVEEIDAVTQKAREAGAAVLAVKSKDTIKIAPNDIIEETPDRENVYMIQTPQGFGRKLLIDAYDSMRSLSCGFAPTDDASVVEKYGQKVHIVEGSYENIKITTVSDVVIAEAILQSEYIQI